MKPILNIVISAFLCCSCSQADDSDPDFSEDENETVVGPGQVAIGALAELPTAVDPVAPLVGDAATDEFNSPSGVLAIDFALKADSGVSLGSDTTSSFYDSVSSPNYGSCEMVNRMRGILQEAASVDGAVCDLNSMFGTNGIPASLQDGKDHIVELTEGGEVIDRFKVNLIKTDNKVTELVVHICEEGEQRIYLRKKVNVDNSFEIFAKKSGGSDNSGPQNISYSSQTKVNGVLDENGKFSGLKTMHQIYSNDFNSDGSDVSYNEYKVVQSSKNIALSGYATQTSKSDPDRLLAFFELIDSNSTSGAYDLKKLAIGAGAILYDDGGSSNTEAGWTGTGSVDSDGVWLAKVSGQDDALSTPPARASDREELGFIGEEVWDCSGVAGTTIADEDLDLGEEEPCDNFSLPQSQNMHLQCHDYK